MGVIQQVTRLGFGTKLRGTTVEAAINRATSTDSAGRKGVANVARRSIYSNAVRSSSGATALLSM
jgi:hypothetical protein